MHSKQTVKTMHENSQTRLTSTPYLPFGLKTVWHVWTFQSFSSDRGSFALTLLLYLWPHVSLTTSKCPFRNAVAKPLRVHSHLYIELLFPIELLKTHFSAQRDSWGVGE